MDLMRLLKAARLPPIKKASSHETHCLTTVHAEQAQQEDPGGGLPPEQAQ